MMLQRLIKILACVVLFITGVVFAEEAEEQKGYLPTDSLHASFVFTGVVTNEAGEHYGYFFQMDRQEQSFHVTAALFDGQSKTVILQEESSAVLDASAMYDWHVGRAFLNFNPINDSWIFGVKTKDKTGFNFKVDMLTDQDHLPATQNLRPGVDFLVSQTGQLNGHIQMGEKEEQFVTSKNAWFRQIWLVNHHNKNQITPKSEQHTSVNSEHVKELAHEQHQEALHAQSFSGVLCYFNDGSGFYSVNTLESDAIRGSEAGWIDAKGMPSAISQFINVKQAAGDGPWHIRVGSPNLHFILSEYLQQNSAIAGFIVEEKTSGFCLLSKNILEDKAIA